MLNFRVEFEIVSFYKRQMQAIKNKFGHLNIQDCYTAYFLKTRISLWAILKRDELAHATFVVSTMKVAVAKVTLYYVTNT